MIRKLEAKDHDCFKDWTRKFIPEPSFYWTPEQLFETWKTCDIWGVFANTQILSAVAVQKSEFSWEILWLATDPAFRGFGHMRSLLGEVLNNATQRGLHVLLEVHENNQKALKLYAQAGFKHVGIRKNYYRDGKNALLLTYVPPQTRA